MKNIVVRKMVPPAFVILAAILAAGSLSTVLAQNSSDRAIGQAQRAVRQQIINQEGGRNLIVLFNTDAQTDFKSRTEVRVRGTGSFSRNNNSRFNDLRNNFGKSRDFSYEAIVNNRSRYGSVSGVRYDLRSGGSDRRDDNRRNNDRDDNERYNNREVDSSLPNLDVLRGARPAGRVTYSGPIMNRHSDKALDVTERSNEDGAYIQQWSFADQPNQNWDVIDLGNGESAIISRQSGKSLTVERGSGDNGATIIQTSWRNSPQQRWRLEQTGGDYYRIVSVDNGKCLDVTREGRQDGANIQLWDYANLANQQWRLRR